MQRNVEAVFTPEALEARCLLSRLDEVQSIICLSVLEPEQFSLFFSKLPKDLKNECLKISNAMKLALFGHQNKVTGIERLQSMHADILTHLQILKLNINQSRELLDKIALFDSGFKIKISEFIKQIEDIWIDHHTALAFCGLLMALDQRVINIFKQRESSFKLMREELDQIFKNIDMTEDDAIASLFKRLNAHISLYDAICALQISVEAAAKDRHVLHQWQLALTNWKTGSKDKIIDILIHNPNVRRVLRENLETLGQLQNALIAGLLDTQSQFPDVMFDEDEAFAQKRKARELYQKKNDAFFSNKHHVMQVQEHQIKSNLTDGERLLKIRKYDEALAVLQVGIKALDLASLELAFRILSSKKPLSNTEKKAFLHISWLVSALQPNVKMTGNTFHHFKGMIEENRELLDYQSVPKSDPLSYCFISDDAIIRHILERRGKVCEPLYIAGRVIISLMKNDIKLFDMELFRRACQFFHYSVQHARDVYNRVKILEMNGSEQLFSYYIYWRDRINNWVTQIPVPTEYRQKVDELIKEYSPKNDQLTLMSNNKKAHMGRK